MHKFSAMFSCLRQAVIVLDNKSKRIIDSNPAAKSALGFDPTGLPAQDILPYDILSVDADLFVCGSTIICGTTIKGQAASISVVRENNYTIFFIDFVTNKKPSLSINRHMISNLRNNTMGIKMSADRCVAALDEGLLPTDKNISVLYHYYYCLLRTLTQIDSADLLERGELPFSPVNTDLVALCTDLTDTVTHLCEETGVNISFSKVEKELFAVVDPAKIEQLLLNLFANSLAHTAEGNSITLTLSRSGNKVIISLDDDGTGIPQEKLVNIFCLPDDSFDDKLNSSGNGLGLYISFGIAQLHKGVLLIESREGDGTHVRVMLPTDETPAPKFNSPETTYLHKEVSSALSGLADVLSSQSYGPKYED